MPPVRSISCSPTELAILDHRGVVKRLLRSQIPGAANTIAKIETYVNGTWIPANIEGYQARIHVFSLTPFSFTVGTWNLGLVIPANWWADA